MKKFSTRVIAERAKLYLSTLMYEYFEISKLLLDLDGFKCCMSLLTMMPVRVNIFIALPNSPQNYAPQALKVM